MHSETGQVKPNAIQRTVRTAHLSVLMTAQLQYTIQQRTFPLTTIIAEMLSTCQICQLLIKFMLCYWRTGGGEGTVSSEVILPAGKLPLFHFRPAVTFPATPSYAYVQDILSNKKVTQGYMVYSRQ